MNIFGSVLDLVFKLPRFVRKRQNNIGGTVREHVPFAVRPSARRGLHIRHRSEESATDQGRK